MQWLEKRWYSDRSAPCWLLPLERLYRYLAERRKQAYLSGKKQSWKAPVPVLVVGNISVGGTGKTPLTLWLVQWLRGQGYSPGIVSRGYGASPPGYPYEVTAASPAPEAGDEPLMMVQRTGCPLVIDPDRPAAVRYLLQHHACDLIISDDGLQHYALGRDIEIAVIDGERGLGNGRCMPAGPLREPETRLHSVDLVIQNGGDPGRFAPYRFNLVPESLHAPDRSKSMPLADLAGGRIHAVAGIGHPQRFFNTLRTAGLEVIEHAFPDHHPFTMSDLAFGDRLPVVMTEKDAVKVSSGAYDNVWFLEVEALPDPAFSDALATKLNCIAK
ncbi:tetraacyldisaccharide 4'-kinase [Marinobacterium jannaschii]|uniref:tetraacyldisaccharide 4'-kinase n=1 Tax=Marinobacterium jannaschii TaxID=64970 RepID=UPI0004894903|nr:tetraacyldisaccharide 4'-kinase [Marinobacterium jannaschii]